MPPASSALRGEAGASELGRLQSAQLTFLPVVGAGLDEDPDGVGLPVHRNAGALALETTPFAGTWKVHGLKASRDTGVKKDPDAVPNSATAVLYTMVRHVTCCGKICGKIRGKCQGMCWKHPQSPAFLEQPMAEVPGDQSAPLRQLELGNALRRHREAADLTLKQVTDALGFSASKLSRIETADRHARADDLERLFDLYDLDRSERARLTNLLEESRQPGWWEKFNLTYSTYVGLEATATTIQDYKTSSIPGLLQTADYARAISQGHHPHASARVIAQRVEAKMIRQQLLERPERPDYQVVIDEAALHRAVGGAETMAHQRAHLIAVAESRHLTLQVIPFDRGWHSGMDTLFNVLSFAEAVGDLVYLDTPHGQEYYKSPKELERYRGIFAQLSAIALDHRDSLRFIRRLSRSG